MGNEWIMKDFFPMEDISVGIGLTAYSGGRTEMGLVPFKEIVKDIEAGKMKVPIGKQWKLEEVGKAHEMMEKGGAGGKMVIVMD